MRLFLDTNVLLDSLARRHPFDKSADALLMLGFLGECELWIGASQLTDIFYLLTTGPTKVSPDNAKDALRSLLKAVNLSGLTSREVEAALASSWMDFEDACLYQCARRIRADAIVTRNKTDFSHSRIPTTNCEELLTWLKFEEGLAYDSVEW